MSRVLPILFNTDMVRAILDGRKTVTRRVAKKIPAETHRIEPVQPFDGGNLKFECHWGGYMPDVQGFKDGMAVVNPPYQPGDILYVRETWCLRYDGEKYFYKADKNTPREEKRLIDYDHEFWKPSIHMPKEAARIWLKVTDVRVERLQEITEEQALSEGVPDSLDYPISKVYCPRCHGNGLIDAISANGYMDVDCPDCDTAIKRFKNLWNSTIKKSDIDRYGWDANPWAWVIEFERCEKPSASP